MVENKSKYFDFTFKNGLVFCQNICDEQNNAEILYIHEAKKLNAEAVFFRRFYQGEEKTPYHSEPAVCIFQVEDNFFNSNDHIKLHAKIWSSGKNEIYILNGKTRVDIINARRPAESDTNKVLIVRNLLSETSNALKIYNDRRFSAHIFESGTFWEQPDFEAELDEGLSPYVYLLRYLMNVRKSFQVNTKANLLPSTIDKLLVVCILIKFLEEIKDDNGKHTLKNIYKKLKTNDLSQAVETGKFLDLLGELTNEFNGKIFDKFSDSEKKTIQNTDLGIIANFLYANIDLQTNQFFLWKQYDFKYLPPEVISAIYENFIQAEAKRNTGELEKGIVYTPTHLVNFLIDEVMPLDKANWFKDEKFKILDPACGSGIFLVAAYKRLLQWWAINNYKDGVIKYPKSKIAQKILEDNIFGIDVKETAIFVTIFSLTTALLDKLSPQEIWNNLKFEDLSLNIQCNNFFEWALDKKNKKESFDLIIGNPPFNIETGKKKDEILNSTTIHALDIKHKAIPNNNLALHFFEGSMVFSNKVCLIIPSNVLLYSKSSQTYRKKIFTNYSINKIFDFTHLRRDLFHKTADTPVVAIVAENMPSIKLKIEHTVVKRTISSQKKIRFEIDYYDKHFVPWDWAIDESKQFIWKTNLLGGGRLFHLIYRLSLLPTILNHIDQKKWKFQRGFEGGDNFSISKQDQILEISKEGELVIGYNAIIKTNNLKDRKFYSPPYLVLDQVLGNRNIPVALITNWSKPQLFFSRDFLGIHGLPGDLTDLQKIYQIIKEKYNKLYQLYALIQSGSCMILTETEINKRDIDSLPYPENESLLSLSNDEKILQDDVLSYYIHLGKAIGNNGAGKIFHQQTDEDQLKKFGKIFCQTLNSIYNKNGKSWQAGKVTKTPIFIIYQFGFGNNKGLKFSLSESNLDNALKNLLKDKLSNSAAIYNRVMRVYKHIDGFDCLFIIKPDTFRYWLKSIALRDADDTFIDLKNSGF